MGNEGDSEASAGTQAHSSWQQPTPAQQPPSKKAMSLAAVVLLAIGGAIILLFIGSAILTAYFRVDHAKVDAAVRGTRHVRNAASSSQVRMLLEQHREDFCPTIDELINSKELEGDKTNDPWGTRYLIECIDGKLHVVSAGRDRQFHTDDDVRPDQLTQEEVKRLMPPKLR